MSRKFLTAIDLTKNELQNAAVQNLAAAPSSPVKGQLYFNSTGGDNTLYWWDGTVWVAAKTTSASFPGYGSVVSEATFGGTSTDGAATTVARSDHKHANPVHDAAAHAAIPLSALAAATASLNAGGYVITNVGTPVAGTDATNKTYVDNAVAGLSWKEAVRVASTANRALTALTAMDGVTPVAGDRILLKDQTAPAENGIWVAAVGAWTRALDADTNLELDGAAVFVEEGTVNSDTAWVMTTNLPITVGTTALAWTQFAGGGTVNAGAGMTQSGNTLNVIGDATITVAADIIGRAALTGDVTATAGSNATTIALDAVTNTKLAKMPANTFKGNNTGALADALDLTVAQTQAALFTADSVPSTAIAADSVTNVKLANMAAHTFKGNNTAAAADPIDLTIAQMQAEIVPANSIANTQLVDMAAHTFKGNNTAAVADPKDLTIAEMQAELAILTTAIAQATYVKTMAVDCVANVLTTVTHNFNSRDVAVDVYRTTTPWDSVECDIERTTVNTVDIRFAVAPTAAQYRIVVQGVDL